MYEATFKLGENITKLRLTAIGDFGDGGNRAKIRELFEENHMEIMEDSFVCYNSCWFSVEGENEVYIDSYHGRIWVEFNIYRRSAMNGNTPELIEADIKSMDRRFSEMISECVSDLTNYPEVTFKG